MQSFDKFTYIRALNGADLTHAEHRVLITVWNYSDKDGQRAYASIARLAADCRMAESTARRSLAGLLNKGFLHRVRRGGRDAEPRASEYELSLPAADPTAHQWPVGEEESTDPTAHQWTVGTDPTAQIERANRSNQATQPLTGDTPSEPNQSLNKNNARFGPAAAQHSQADALVNSALPDAYPRSTIADLTYRAAEMLTRGDTPELVRRALEIWDAKPDAGPGLLPHLAAEAAKSLKPKPSTVDQKVAGWLNMRIGAEPKELT